MRSDHLVVITGGPGSGKTTLIDALEAAGFARTHEAGRGIIRDQTAIGGPALPWRDPMVLPSRCSPVTCAPIGWRRREQARCSATAAFPTRLDICD